MNKRYTITKNCVACNLLYRAARKDQLYCSAHCLKTTWAKLHPRTNRCRASAYVVEWRQLEPQGLRRCKQCDKVKNIQEFWGISLPSRRSFVCAVCCATKQKATRKRYGPDDKARARAKKWREAHPEIFRKRIAAWHSKNPLAATETARKRRSRKAEAGVFHVTVRDLTRLLQRQQFKCGLCLSSEFIGGKELDHIIPISRGGRHSIGNLMWLCHKCNRKKHTLYLVEVKYGKRINTCRHSALQQRASIQGMPKVGPKPRRSGDAMALEQLV